jgi:hypothetical protein
MSRSTYDAVDLCIAKHAAEPGKWMQAKATSHGWLRFVRSGVKATGVAFPKNGREQLCHTHVKL